MISKFLALLCLLIAGQAFAQNPCLDLKQKYNISLDVVPLNSTEKQNLLHDLDIIFGFFPQKLSWVDFATIRKEIKGLNLCLNRSRNALVGSGVREGSVYYAVEKTIIFNANVLNQSSDRNSALNIVHEFLGALGYPDENYEITSYMYSKIQQDQFFSAASVSRIENSLIDFLRNQKKRRQNIQFAAEGGSSGVGGGGDPEIIFLKAAMLNMFLENLGHFNQLVPLKKETTAVLSSLLTLRFETDAALANTVKLVNPTPHIFIAYDQAIRQSYLSITRGEWNRLLELGDAGFNERSMFVQNLVSVALVIINSEDEN